MRFRGSAERSRRRGLGRVVLLLAALGASGAGLRGGADSTSGSAPNTPPAPPPPAHVQYLKAPAAKPANPKLAAEIVRLRQFIEAGEKALEEKDWDGAFDWSGKADDLVDEWPGETLALPEVDALVQRLEELEQHLPDTEEVPAVPDPGLKEGVEVTPLSPADRSSELQQVQNADDGAVFDFPIDLNDKVLAWVHQFTHEKKGFMERALSRASQYLPMVRQIFSEEGIPKDLAYLAVIESGYVNSAASYAKAVGMWQFMRSTGRIYGLGGNAWVEERRDPVKATRAAARYLKRLYEVSGDWYLALVGYNAGPLTTERAIQNLGSRNFWDMARSRWLRNQTKNYVPELCAAILVGHFPERYGLQVQQLPPYAYETVEVDHMTSLPVLARFAQSDVDALKELNPELLRATTPPGSYILRVPPGQGGATARALASIPASQRLDFKSYRIRRGENLVRVARRFHVATEDLLAANNLSKAQFRAGRVIKVPPPPVEPIDARDLRTRTQREHSIEDRPLDDLPAIPAGESVPALDPARESPRDPVAEPSDHPASARPARRIVKAREEKPVPAAPARPAFHHVKRGETLTAIAERYGLEVDELKRWNHLRRSALQPGQRLRLRR